MFDILDALVRPGRRAAPACCAALLLASLAAVPGPALAQWKWRDAGGQITASDRAPPKEVPEKDILERPHSAQRRPTAAAAAAAPASAPSPLAAATPAAAAPRTALDAEVEARKKAAEQQADAKARADEQKLATQRAENCRRARSHQAALESGQRIARVNDKGEREVMDDKAVADELRSAREVIASDCR